MPKKIDSFVLSDDMIKIMKHLMSLSRTNNVEVGSSLCRKIDEKDIHIRYPCFGDECSVQITGACKSGERSEGDFHTHVLKHGTELPTLIDIQNLLHSDRTMVCIGRVPTSMVGCYVLKPDVRDKAKFDVFHGIKNISKFVRERTIKKLQAYKLPTPEELDAYQKEFGEKHDEIMSDILNKYFNKISFKL